MRPAARFGALRPAFGSAPADSRTISMIRAIAGKYCQYVISSPLRTSCPVNSAGSRSFSRRGGRVAKIWSHTDAGPEKSTVGTPRSAVDQGPATPSRNDSPTTSSSMRNRTAPFHRRAASTNSPSALHAAASSSAVNITKPPSSTTPTHQRHRGWSAADRTPTSTSATLR